MICAALGSTVRGKGYGPTAAPGRVAETRDHEWVSAGQTHVRAELGVDDLDAAAGSTEGGGGDFGSSRPEQSLSLSIRDRTADHDPGWVQRIDETDAGNSEGASAALHDGPASRITRVLALGDAAGLDHFTALLSGSRLKERTRAIDHSRSGRAGHCVTADERLQMTDRAARAQAFHGDRGMAELAGSTVRAVEDAALRHDRPAAARGDGGVNEVGTVAGRPEGHLAESGDVGVALEEGRQVEAVAEFGGDGDVDKVGAHVGGLNHHTAPRIDRAGTRDAYPNDCTLDIRGDLARHVAKSSLAGVEDRRRASGHRRAPLGLGDAGPVVQDDRSKERRVGK